MDRRPLTWLDTGELTDTRPSPPEGRSLSMQSFDASILPAPKG